MIKLGLQKKCEIEGNNIVYYDIGEGEPVVLVHGITTYSFIWRRIVPLLENNYRVITVDLLGCGDSDKPLDVEYSIKNHSRLIHALVKKLDLPKIHFVGHDLGGGIGQIFAVNYPDTLLDLTVINTVAYNFWPVQPIIAMRTPIIRQMIMSTLDWGSFKLIVKRGIYHKERVTDELMKLFWYQMETKEGRKGFLHFARSIDNNNLMELESELRELEVPVLIIRGDSDVYLSGEIAERLDSELPDSRLVRIKTAGHFMQEDEPEWIVDQLKAHFKSA